MKSSYCQGNENWHKTLPWRIVLLWIIRFVSYPGNQCLSTLLNWNGNRLTLLFSNIVKFRFFSSDLICKHSINIGTINYFTHLQYLLPVLWVTFWWVSLTFALTCLSMRVWYAYGYVHICVWGWWVCGWIHTNVWVWLGLWMCVQNDVFIIVCVEIRGQNSLDILILFLRQDLSLNIEVIDSIRLVNVLQRSFCLCTQHWNPVTCYCTWLFMWVLGI